MIYPNESSQVKIFIIENTRKYDSTVYKSDSYTTKCSICQFEFCSANDNKSEIV